MLHRFISRSILVRHPKTFHLFFKDKLEDIFSSIYKSPSNYKMGPFLTPI